MAELAYHWAAAGDQPRALVASLAAAHGAAAEYAFAESAGHYERAIELWDRVPEAERLVGSDLAAVLSDASAAAGLAGHAGRALALAREAIERFDGAEAEPERAALLEDRLAWAAMEFGDVVLATEALTLGVGAVAVRAGVDRPRRW